VLDPVATERAEAEVDSFIERRAREREKANSEAEALRAADEKRWEKLYAENRTLWIHHHGKMAKEHARLSAEHERRARSLLGKPEGVGR
jgi:hypothetical protein